MARELAVYQRTWRRPDRGPSLRLVIFGSGRTGSSLLMDLLNSHPEIECEDEIPSHRVLSARRFLDARAALSRRPVFGFKLKLHHLTTQGITDPAAFLGRLHAGGCRIVHLTRRDRLRQALSSAVARQRLAQHQTVAGRQPRPGPFRIDVPWLIRRMRELDASLDGRDDRDARSGERRRDPDGFHGRGAGRHAAARRVMAGKASVRPWAPAVASAEAVEELGAPETVGDLGGVRRQPPVVGVLVLVGAVDEVQEQGRNVAVFWMPCQTPGGTTTSAGRWVPNRSSFTRPWVAGPSRPSYSTMVSIPRLTNRRSVV
jgi:hypothetical protein